MMFWDWHEYPTVGVFGKWCVQAVGSESSRVEKPFWLTDQSPRRRRVAGELAGEKVKTAPDLFAFICTKSLLAEYGMIWNVNSVFSITLKQTHWRNDALEC